MISKTSDTTFTETTPQPDVVNVRTLDELLALQDTFTQNLQIVNDLIAEVQGLGVMTQADFNAQHTEPPITPPNT